MNTVTLEFQIRDIATRWFNLEFAKLPIPRIVNSLAIEAFRKGYNCSYNTDTRAILEALELIDKLRFTTSTLSVI